MKLLWCAGPQALICICMTGSSIRVIIHLCQAECWFWSKKSGEIIQHKSEVWFNSVYNPFFSVCLLHPLFKSCCSGFLWRGNCLMFLQWMFCENIKKRLVKNTEVHKKQEQQNKTLFYNGDCLGSKCRPFKWLRMHLYLLSFSFSIAWWTISKQKKI